MSYRIRQAVVATAGGDGSASGVATIGINPAKLCALAIDYVGQPATTDITITSSGKTVYAKTNSATDVPLTTLLNPGMDEGGAATNPVDTEVYVSDDLTVTVAQGNAAAAAAVVTFLLEE
jgi:hypothetical protein